ncbi:MAG TPA: carbohydrate ABC transporter permease [Candidatus Hydrogenedentes bacterium]|nr:carbohydrate ABC transporter permease [Candidatus Hydrogenedentota bacterium]
MRKALGRAAVYAVLIAWLLAVVLPLVWVFSTSFRSSQEIFENPFGIPWLISGSPYADNAEVASPRDAAKANYLNAWVKSRFSHFFLNSIVVTTVSLVGVLTCASMAAYVLARFKFRGGRLMLLYFLSGMMVPAQLVLVPLFFQFTYMSEAGSRLLAPFGLSMSLHDSLTGLIAIYIALSLPFTILVLTGFFKSLPGTLREAGIIDGCGEYRVFWHIMLPLARPGMITAAIFNFLGIWNEYLFALVFVNSETKKTLPLGLAGVSMQAQYKTDFGLMFAGLVIVLVPTLAVYILLQRHLTRGITVGALKG